MTIRNLALVLLLALLPACAPMIMVGDQNIEVKAGIRINQAHRDLVHINITSYNRNVLLTGEAPTAAVKADIEKIVAGIENVRGVVNDIAVAGASSYGTRTNDSYITSKVKAAFVTGQKFYPGHVKVVTESSVVYLLGLVLRKEADDATEIARGVGGVQKVVRVFEYVILAPKTPPSPAPPPGKSGG